MDSEKSHECPEEAPAFDELNFSQSPAIDDFLKALRSADAERCLEMISSLQIRVVDNKAYEWQQEQMTQYSVVSGNLEKYQSALETVRAERDALLEGVFHLYHTFHFIYASIESSRNGSKPGTLASLLGKFLKAAGLKNISPEAIMVTEQIIVHMKNNMDTLTANMERLGSKLNPSLEILIRHNIIKAPKTELDSPNSEN